MSPASMLSKRHISASHNLCVATENHTDLRDVDRTKYDARPFSAAFPQEILAVQVSHAEQQNDSHNFSRLELAASLDTSTQATSTATVNQSSTMSAAQQVVACYRATRDRGHPPERVPMNTAEKELPQIPDDRRSMYTLAASTDTPPTMDMMWRPKPKVHMRRSDQQALMQAQSQAIAMMRDAGLKPTNKIQCRRRGCADILPDVEALKYHLHIHNIADATTEYSDPSAARRFHLPEWTTSNSESSKGNHSRSKSSLATQQKRSTTSSIPRNLSAGSLLPALFSLRESNPGASKVLTLTTVAKTIVSDSSVNQPTSLLPMRASMPSRGRRKRKESMAISVGAECSSSIATLPSPSSVMHGRLVLAPHAKLPVSVAPGTAMDDESDNRVSILNEIMHPVSEQLTGSRSSERALSPTRAISPIRNGIKRILSIGCPDNVVDK